MVDSRKLLNGRMLALMLVALLGAVVTYAQSDGWSKWRGPDGTGISGETKWNPASLSKGPKFVWKINVHPGYSAISVKGSYAFTMGYQDGKDVVLCLRTKDGSEVWRYSYSCKLGKYQGNRLGRTCRRRDHGKGGGTGPSEILVGEIQKPLIAGIGMGSGHKALFNPKTV